MDDKELKAFVNILTKLSASLNDVYIVKMGYALNLDVDKPILIQFNEYQMELFEKAFPDFKIVHITNVKKYKAAGTEEEKNQYFEYITLKSKSDAVISKMDYMLSKLGECESFVNLTLSEEDKETLFTYNEYTLFNPSDSDAAEIILTKSLLPYVTAKNTDIVTYSSRLVSDGMSLIVFNIDFPMFRVLAFHHYLTVNTNLITTN